MKHIDWKNIFSKVWPHLVALIVMILLSSVYFAPYLRLAGVKSSDKMVAIPNALRFTEFATEEDIQSKQHTALVVARFDDDTKRISLVLKAWKQIEQDPRFNDWELQLVGDGRDRGFYEHLVTKWNLQHVEFTGQQNPQEYYRQASVFLMTSSAEGWPLVLLEASQMGTPIVAMDTFESLHDIVTDGVEGFITERSLDAFVSCVTRVMTENQKRQDMAQKVIEKSHCFTIDVVLKKWINLFKCQLRS